MSVPNDQTDNKPSLVQLNAWRWTKDKSFPKPVTTQI